MATHWCKVASNLDSHPRIRRAGRDGREVFLFALRRNAEPGHKTPGYIKAEDLDPDYLADILMMPRDAAVTAVTACDAVGLLRREGELFAIVGWDDDWGKAPKSGTERTQRWRENKKIQADAESVTSTTSTTVTGDAGDALDKKRVDKIEREASPKRRSPKAKVQVEPDWRPPEPLDSNQERELERFRNHHRAKGNTFANVGLAWANWLSRSAEWSGSRGTNGNGEIRQKNQIG